MLWTLLAWISFGFMIWYTWSGIAIIAAAPRANLSMLWMVGVWQLVCAIGAFLVWRSALADTLTFGAIIGLILAASNPLLWKLGFIGKRLHSHGVRLGTILMFR